MKNITTVLAVTRSSCTVKYGSGKQSYLDFNVSNFSCGADDWPANQRRENVFGEVGSCIATLDKLRRDQKRKEKQM